MFCFLTFVAVSTILVNDVFPWAHQNLGELNPMIAPQGSSLSEDAIEEWIREQVPFLESLGQ